ncbi:DeoR/GlpR family DNA-binding transcription regulator [Vagococcus carniphilus]|uniref:DeoR/GlpR family DNA-binding transcription regulator n=1 Tax=Vagococcus carniphilus TaxID=218144 RepID=UPI00288C9DB2|nr:DeoR/GlpR family DNA-binding transcription regulator [Vagococcus carniphilus]MDT2850372.1 DeoR/GlpR family DNA-binding transcription regulator [Vagococcus carniphilus]
MKKRRDEIVSIINEKNEVDVAELSKRFNVSKPTIRADLNELDEQGLIHRTHGGAKKKELDFPLKDSEYDERKLKNIEDKKEIAKKALSLIEDDDCICLDASSTCYELAKLIFYSDKKITVLTSGLRTANLLKESNNLTVIIIGGIVKAKSNAVEGNLSSSLIQMFNIKIFFTSSYAISINEGLSDFSLHEANLKNELIRASLKTVALIDHTKFNKNSIIKFGNLSDINAIITDRKISPEVYKQYSNRMNIIK